MTSTLFKQNSARKTIVFLLLAFIIAIGTLGMSTVSAYATPGGVPYNSYEMYGTYTDPVDQENTQEVFVRFTYSDPVSVGGTAASDFAVTVANNSRAVKAVYPDPSNPNVLVIELEPAYAQMSAVISIKSSGITDITVGGKAIDDINLTSVIPTGISISNTRPTTDNVIGTIETRAKVRSMNHFGVYISSNGTLDGQLTPIWVDASSDGVIHTKTYTVHSHSFVTQTEIDYASALADALSNTTAFINSGYVVDYTSGDDFVTVSLKAGGSVENVVFAVLDDNLLQAHHITYDDLVIAGGVLPAV
jgi:hypothetical protein